MRLVLHGYGKMGHAVERIAQERGHQIVATIGRGQTGSEIPATDAIIDFSTADAIEHLIELAAARQTSLVIGTTGWNNRLDAIRTRCEQAPIGVVYASNFSPGANVTFALARRAGEMFARMPQYSAGIEERHHAQKKDAPSGTALRIASEVSSGMAAGTAVPIASSRVGSEIGLHRLFFDSPDDVVEISHRARSRDAFARGAVIAAELVAGRRGFFSFDELISLEA